jgi:hypothetical protein
MLVLLANRAFPDELLDILVNSGPTEIGFSLMNNIVVPRMACWEVGVNEFQNLVLEWRVFQKP